MLQENLCFRFILTPTGFMQISQINTYFYNKQNMQQPKPFTIVKIIIKHASFTATAKLAGLVVKVYPCIVKFCVISFGCEIHRQGEQHEPLLSLHVCKINTIMVNVTHTGCDANIQSWLGCLFLAQGHRESLEMGKRAT